MPTYSRCGPKVATKNKSICQSDFGLGHLNVGCKKASVLNLRFTVLTPSLEEGTLPTTEMNIQKEISWCFIL